MRVKYLLVIITMCVVLVASGLAVADILAWRIYLVILLTLASLAGWLAWKIHQRNSSRLSRRRREPDEKNWGPY